VRTHQLWWFNLHFWRVNIRRLFGQQLDLGRFYLWQLLDHERWFDLGWFFNNKRRFDLRRVIDKRRFDFWRLNLRRLNDQQHLWWFHVRRLFHNLRWFFDHKRWFDLRWVNQHNLRQLDIGRFHLNHFWRFFDNHRWLVFIWRVYNGRFDFYHKRWFDLFDNWRLHQQRWIDFGWFKRRIDVRWHGSSRAC
jgi:hypothetical protein